MSDIPAAARDASVIEQADAQVAEAASQARDHPVVKVLGKLSELADQPPLIILSSLTLTAGLMTGRRPLARAGARMLAAHLIATAAKTVIKDRVDRTRPHVLVDEGRYSMEAGDDSDKAMRSFPSGHTAGIVAVTRALAREYPAAALPGAALSIAVAGVQIPRCAHYPSDIGAGAIIGLAAEALVDTVARRFP